MLRTLRPSGAIPSSGMTSRTSDPAEAPKRSHPGARELIGRYVPITGWLPKYPRAWLGKDIGAGITSWAVMVPVAMA